MCTASSARRTWRAARSQSEYTATAPMFMSRQARMMRTAISPRLAIRILLTAWLAADRVIVSERDVPVLLWRVLVALRLERGEAGDQLRARLVRPDDFVDEPALRRDEWIGELLAIFGHLRGAGRREIARRFELAL